VSVSSGIAKTSCRREHCSLDPPVEKVSAALPADVATRKGDGRKDRQIVTYSERKIGVQGRREGGGSQNLPD
jgi:hypothetical protein